MLFRSKKFEHRIKGYEVELTAVLGSTNITVADFLSFDEGDIILLDTKVDQAIDLFLEGKLKFKINLGKSGSKMAGQITDIIRKVEADE